MATKIRNFFDFLRGLFCGVLVGLTERPTNPRTALNDFLQKRREAKAEETHSRSEIGLNSSGD
jgi:hypothetical protein